MGAAHSHIRQHPRGWMGIPPILGLNELLKELTSGSSWGGISERESDGTGSHVLVTSGVMGLGCPLPFLFPVTKEKHQLQEYESRL